MSKAQVESSWCLTPMTQVNYTSIAMLQFDNFPVTQLSHPGTRKQWREMVARLREKQVHSRHDELMQKQVPRKTNCRAKCAAKKNVCEAIRKTSDSSYSSC